MHRKQKDSYCHIKLDKWSEYFLFIINNIKLLTLKFEDVPRGAYRTGEKKAESQLIEIYDVATFRSDITFINLLAVFLH